MDTVSIANAALKGWRAKVADAVARPVSRQTRLTDDQVRAAVGASFFVLSMVYVVGTIRRLASRS